MTEEDVTAEMVTAGWLALTDVIGHRRDRSLADEDKLLRTIYRVMRALEPSSEGARLLRAEILRSGPRVVLERLANGNYRVVRDE